MCGGPLFYILLGTRSSPKTIVAIPEAKGGSGQKGALSCSEDLDPETYGSAPTGPPKYVPEIFGAFSLE